MKPGQKNNADGESIADDGEQIDAEWNRTNRHQTEKMPQHCEQWIARRMSHAQCHGGDGEFRRVANDNVACSHETIQKSCEDRHPDRAREWADIFSIRDRVHSPSSRA